MKKLLVLFLIALPACIAVFPQVTNDPNDPLYRDLERWYEQGFVTRLPPLRPYPPQLIVEFLADVEKNGTSADRNKAADYRKYFGNDLTIRPSGIFGLRTSADGLFSEAGGGFFASGFIMPLISVSARLNVTADKLDTGFILPAYTSEPVDHNSDWANISIFSVRQALISNVTFGNGTAYFQAGIQRTSFGPFFKSGGIVDASAPHAGHFSFTWRNQSFTYTALLLELTASLDNGTRAFPDKHFFLHSINFYPLEWLDLGFFESVIWGQRFDIVYLMPLKELFYTQSITGFNDNSLFGVTADLTPGAGTRFSLALNIDDLHFNDLVSFKFDTKYKLALQYGASWSPAFPWLQRIGFTHQLVMPYMYTHLNDTNQGGANFVNYTHMAKNLGSTLQPNSEKYTFEYFVNPLSLLDIAISGALIRHGNASTGFNIPNGDGSIFDSGWDVNGQPTFQGHTRFLEQKIIERTWQIDMDASLKIPDFHGFTVRGNAGYTFEYIENSGLVEGKSVLNNFFRIGLSLTY